MSLSIRINDLATRVGQECQALWAAVNGKAPLASPTFTGTVTMPRVTMTPSVGTAKGRFGGLDGVEAWTGMFLNASYVAGSGWLLDDNTKPGWFFKLDSRAIATEFAVYRIPAGAGYHTDEALMFKVDGTGLMSVVNRITGVANATGATDALPKGQADNLYATPTGTQTLTNKTLALGSNTVTGTLAQFNTAVTDADLVDLDDAQTLTNKTISADSNTLSGIAASSFVVSNGSGNIDGAAAQKAIPVGPVVGTSDAQTLTNKTLALGVNTITGAFAQFNTAVTDADFVSTAPDTSTGLSNNANNGIGTGFYWLGGSVTGGSLNGPPVGDVWGFIAVQNSYNGDFIHQLWRSWEVPSAGVWERRRIRGVWGSWERVDLYPMRVVYTTTVPARPANATYVEWVGQTDPAANSIAGDTWVPTV